jgi:3-methyladenine DNA glycosylase AlkD
MSAKGIVGELEALGSESIKKVLKNHGAPEPLFGVKVGDMKPIQKRIKQDYQLALDLYETGIYDAMYLAGLIADDARMTPQDLDRWVKKAPILLATSTVAWVAAGSPHGRALALKWIDARDEHIAVAGWSTLSSLVSIKDDAELDLAELERLLQRVQKTIHQAPNFVRSAMNGFVIAVGAYVSALSDAALRTGEQIGRVSVDVGKTACEIPFAPESIQKVRARGSLGKKRKSAKC